MVVNALVGLGTLAMAVATWRMGQSAKQQTMAMEHENRWLRHRELAAAVYIPLMDALQSLLEAVRNGSSVGGFPAWEKCTNENRHLVLQVPPAIATCLDSLTEDAGDSGKSGRLLKDQGDLRLEALLADAMRDAGQPGARGVLFRVLSKGTWADTFEWLALWQRNLALDGFLRQTQSNHPGYPLSLEVLVGGFKVGGREMVEATLKRFFEELEDDPLAIENREAAQAALSHAQEAFYLIGEELEDYASRHRLRKD